MTDKPDRAPLFAGIFVLCGLILLGGLILEFGPLRHRMRDPYRIHAVFLDAQNLVKGAPVKRAGATIGRVATDPKLTGDLKGVQVDLEIYPEFMLPRNSRFRIGAVGLMGDSVIDVIPPPEPTGQFIQAGETVEGDLGGDLQSSATRITEQAVIVMTDIRSGLSELNRTLAKLNSGVLSDENLENFSGALRNLNAAIGKFDSEVLSEANTSGLAESIRTFQEATVRVSDAAEHASSALAKMDRAFDHLEPGVKGVAGATDSLRDAASALQSLLRDAREGTGLLHSLLNDRKLAEDFTRLIANLREHGILWYKNREKREPEPRSQRARPFSPRR